ncbi:unnamed protein product [Rotaria sp. Silwood1]|nr:unnamed protein product [Rotaria sp. Silwood1]
MDIRSVQHNLNSTERIYAGHVNNLNDFYIYSYWTNKKLREFRQDAKQAYENSLKQPLELNKINVGYYYCAYSTENDEWYRVLIHKMHSNGHATVFKIDYGELIDISIQSLKPLQEWMFDVPRLAIHCSLANLITPINGWPSNVIDIFRSRLKQSYLYARFINFNKITNIYDVIITKDKKDSVISINTEFENYNMEPAQVPSHNTSIYKNIPLETLTAATQNQIRLRYYVNPNDFYVYLLKRLEKHNNLQFKLQHAVQNSEIISQPIEYETIAARDDHAIWHRGVILDIAHNDLSKILVFFIDIGARRYIPIKDIRKLPEEFLSVEAFAIPCRLYNIYSCNFNQNDKINNEIQKYVADAIDFHIYAKYDDICYYVGVTVPEIGDVATYLIQNKLASVGTSSLTQQQEKPIQQQRRNSNNSNNMSQQPQTCILPTGIKHTTSQQSILKTTDLSSSIHTIPPLHGKYWLTHICSGLEFYGFLASREREFETVCKDLHSYYDNYVHAQSLSVNAISEGMMCIIRQYDHYYRVIIKHHESESKVLVKLIDRGDETVVHTSELLQINNKFSKIPAFVQPFRLQGYDESQNTTSVTHTLKKLAFNQWVDITLQERMINGFYPVHIMLPKKGSINQMILQR